MKYFPENIKYIESEDNSTYKTCLKLLSSHGQRKSKSILVRGWREFSLAQAIGARLDLIILDDSKDSQEIFELNPDKFDLDKLVVLSRALYIKLAGDLVNLKPMAVISMDLDSFDSNSLTAHDRVLVLDRVQDPGNVGTLLRTAAAFNFNKVVLLKGTAQISNPKLWRAAAGSLPCLDLYSGVDQAEFLAQVECQSLSLLVADLDGISPGNYRLENPYDPAKGLALVLANEGHGPDPGLRQAAQAILTLPISVGAESLNVAVAGGILMYCLGGN